MITHRSVATLGSSTLASFHCSVNDDWVMDEGVEPVVHEHLGQSDAVRTRSEAVECHRSDDLD